MYIKNSDSKPSRIFQIHLSRRSTSSRSPFRQVSLAAQPEKIRIFNYHLTGNSDKDSTRTNVTEHLSAGSVEAEASFPGGDVSFAREKSHLPFSRCQPAAMAGRENTGNGGKARVASSILPRKDPGRPWRRSGRHRCDFDSLSAFPGETGLD